MGLAKSSHGRRKEIPQTASGTVRQIRLSDRSPSYALRSKRGEVSTIVVRCSARKKHAHLTFTATLAPYSTITVVLVWDGKQGAHITQKCTVGAAAKLHLLNITRGSCVHETVSEVTGAQGESRIDWIVRATDRMECVLSATNLFRTRGGKGDLTMRGVAEGRAKIVCNGDVSVGPKAAGTRAHLTEKILVLDPTARADAIPSLDVRTHDVQASHSASVSRIHPEDLFYFASRGITAAKARKLFIDGFLGDALAALPAGACRALMECM